MRMLYVRYYMTPTPKQESEVWAKVVTAKTGGQIVRNPHTVMEHGEHAEVTP